MIVLDVAVFTTLDASWNNTLDEYIYGANYHLANFDMKLSVHPARPAAPLLIPLAGNVHDRPPDVGVALLPGDLRTAAHAVLPHGVGIPIIYCKFYRTSDAAFTVYTSDTGANRGVQWLNYVLVKESQLNVQRDVILHELIHAANYQGNANMSPYWDKLHDKEPDSVMRMPSQQYPNQPTVMMERHATALRTAYFARQI